MKKQCNKNVTMPELKYLFSPASIAQIGASPKAAPGRFNFIQYLQGMGYPGKIYPVNPNYRDVYGLKCYKSLAEAPGEVDLAILALPAPHCAEALEDIFPGKVKFVIVHTSGFSEIDKNHLEKDLLDLAREKNFRIIGPNCMGVFCQESKVCFWDDHKEFVNRPGTVGFVSQSGGITIDVITGSIDPGIGINKAISLGNQIDVSISELIEHMADDSGVKVIAVYVEDVKNGRRFLELIRKITPEKPVLVWKGGLTEIGRAAAKTHTGSMAGNADVFRAAMRQAGAIMIDNIQQMLRMLILLQPPLTIPGQRLAIICPGGGNTVGISDAFSGHRDLIIPQLAPGTREKLQALLPEENVDTKNPVDPGAVGMLKLDKILGFVGEDPSIDAILLMLFDEIPFSFKDENARQMIIDMLTAMIAEATRKIGKPIYIHVLHNRDNNEEVFHCRRLMVDKLIERKIPWTDGSFSDAAAAFSRLMTYSKFVENIKKNNI